MVSVDFGNNRKDFEHYEQRKETNKRRIPLEKS